MSGFDIRAFIESYRERRITRDEFRAGWYMWQQAGAKW